MRIRDELKFLTRIVAFLGGVMLTISHGPAQAAEDTPSLNTAIWQASKACEAWLRGENCHSVAVLRFDTYWKGDQHTRHDQGPIHVNLARRFEKGLIVVQRARDSGGQPQTEILVALDANRVAATIPGADLNSTSGRHALLTGSFIPAWGTAEFQPDAFITGLLRFDSLNTNNVSVIVMGFTRKLPEMVVKLGEFPADLAIQDLIDTGRSFTTRGLPYAPQPQSINQPKPTLPTEASHPIVPPVSLEQLLIVNSVQARTNPADSPLLARDQPVRLRIFYGNHEQQLTLKNGEVMVPEPLDGQQVRFVVERQGPEKRRLGIVLKINGENSYAQERDPDSQCTKWIMEPEGKTLSIDGFQITPDRRLAFRIAGRQESKNIESQFGTQVGTISLTVFGELGESVPMIRAEQFVQGTKPVPRLPESLDPNNTRPLDLLAIAEGDLPTQPAKDRIRCQVALRQASGATRGLIQGGQSQNIHVDKTTFNASLLPLMSGTVRYYRKVME